MQFRAAAIVSTLAIGMMAVVATVSAAQESAPADASAPAATPWRPSIGLPLPPIGLPLPTIGLPLGATPPVAAPPAATGPNAPATPGPRHRPGGGSQGRGPVLVYPFLYVPPASVGVAIPGTAAGAGTSVGAPAGAATGGIGRVRFDVTPAQAIQIYVDGYYVGTPEDYPEGVELPSGPHALELRGARLQTHASSVQVPPGRSLTYRATLEVVANGVAGGNATADATAPAVSPAAPADHPPSASGSPFYLIPGCYLGNVPPDEHNTPAGCDLSQVRTQSR